jgi:hypothetical protein
MMDENELELRTFCIECAMEMNNNGTEAMIKDAQKIYDFIKGNRIPSNRIA